MTALMNLIPSIHDFGSSGEAYDACQCDDNIKTGDTLVIYSEKVVGVAHTWPVAVTAENGALHRIKDGVTNETVADDDHRMLTGLKAAEQTAMEMGWPLRGQAEPSAIKVHVETLDGFKKTHLCKDLTEARKAARGHVGATPDIGSDYAVSADGVAKVTVDGATLKDLFPESAA